MDGPDGLSELADWVYRVVRELVGDSPFAMVANSLGGLIARDIARRLHQQVLGMSLLAPVVDPIAANRTRPEQTVVVRDQEFMASLGPIDAELYQEVAVIQSPANWQLFENYALPGIKAANESAMDRLDANYALPDNHEDAESRISGPVLILSGKQDHSVGHQDQRILADQYPYATYELLDPAGHNLHLDQPYRVHHLLNNWSNGV